MNNEYIKLHRKMMNWKWFQKPFTRLVFEYLLLVARYDKGSFRGVEINRGQVCKSLKTIAEENNISVQSVRTAIKHLKLTGDITYKQHNQFVSIITIVNYDEYQSI